MQFLRKVLATFVFEFRRSLTRSRISTSIVLILFAPAMLYLIGSFFEGMDNQIIFPLIILGVFHLLSIFLTSLLWATPVVFSELEGKTWSYLSIRPYGKLASTLGKYLNAVFWATMTSTLSLFLCCLVVSQFPWDAHEFVFSRMRMANTEATENFADSMAYSSRPGVLFTSLFPGILLGSMALSAIFVHIGLVTHKRGMVFAVIYGVVETIFSFLPAMIKQFTIGYHIRSIGLKTARFEPPVDPDFPRQLVVDDVSIWVHFMVLLVIVVVHVGAAIFWLHSREYITAEES